MIDNVTEAKNETYPYELNKINCSVETFNKSKKASPKLRFVHINIRNIYKNLEQFETEFKTEEGSIDFIGMSECWMSTNNRQSHGINMNGYNSV